uniref:Uncharacterized protein n=1 Tax=Siphoviridae sp. ct4085 TaxID=2827774 RepID=A0A8S5SG02_9CAUD|nr:MAG TPA: hypothetical protein [Siphoviridae sp. ct4085]
MKTNEELQETISKIEERLADIRINRFVNAPVKEGYLKSIEILRDHQTDITRAKLEELKTVQGRAIAALAIDYLMGECAQYVLLGVPIKDR